jgi:hypothetical protein
MREDWGVSKFSKLKFNGKMYGHDLPCCPTFKEHVVIRRNYCNPVVY